MNPYFKDPYKKENPEFLQDKPGTIPTPSTFKGKPAGEVKAPKPEETKDMLEAKTPEIETRASWCGLGDDAWVDPK